MKRCACGATYTSDGWTALPLVTNHNAPSGEIDSAGVRLQFRLCRCGSTLAVALGDDMQGKRLTDAELTEQMRDIQRRGLGDHAADLREHIASLTPPTPEDVARDVKKVREALSSGRRGVALTTIDAFERLASAAARVPGLEVRSTLLAQVVESLGGQEHPPERWPWLAKLKSDGLAEYAAARGRLDTLLETHASDVYGLRTTMNQDGIGWEAMLSEVITRYGRMAALLKASHDVGHLDVPMPERLAVLLAAHDGNCAATRETLAEVTSERDTARQEAAVLKADNAALLSLVRRAIYGKADRSCTECGKKDGCAEGCEMARAAAAHHPGAALLEELSAFRAQVDTLTARVAELEAELAMTEDCERGADAVAAEALAAQRAAESERDALRAEVERLARDAEAKAFLRQELADKEMESSDNATMNVVLTPAPAGLLEAVWPDDKVEEFRKHVQDGGRLLMVDLLRLMDSHDALSRLAAYDAAKGGEEESQDDGPKGCDLAALREALADILPGVRWAWSALPSLLRNLDGQRAENAVDARNWRKRRNYWRRRYQDQRDLMQYWKDAARDGGYEVGTTDDVEEMAEKARKWDAANERHASVCFAGMTREEAMRVLLGLDTPPSDRGTQPHDSERIHREMLGREVRAEWVAWAKEQPSPKASWLVPWEGLSEPDKEVDRRIGVRLYNIGRNGWDDPTPPSGPDGGEHSDQSPEHREPVTLGKGPFRMVTEVAARAVEETHRAVTNPTPKPTPEVPALKPEPAAPEVVFCAKGVTVNADGSYSQEPGFHMYEVVGAFARALAEAKREAVEMRKAHEAVQYADANRSWATAGGDVIAIHAARLEEDTAEAERMAAESMRARAAKRAEEDAVHGCNPFGVCTCGNGPDVAERIAEDIRDLPLEDE